MFSRSTSNFDRLVEKATSHLLLEPDWNSILQICDTIRGGDVPPKYALNSIKKRLYAPNPNVGLFALQTLESCVKNCGAPFHVEIASKAFMEELRDLIKMTANDKVKEKVLELIQTWAHAFRNDPTYRAVQDTLGLMKAEGFKFPVLKESDAMYAADAAPQWADADVCNRCRVVFSLVQRKHHCRNCGQIFCHKCSSKQSTIPKFGIEKEVRVCEDCFDKLNKPSSFLTKTGSGSEQSSPAKVPVTGSKASAPSKTEQELMEEEELQMAIALSQSEAEIKEKEQRKRTSSLPITGKSINNNANHSPVASLGRRSEPSSPKTTTDPELARYLDRDYWEQKATQPANAERVARSTSPAPSAPQQVALKQINEPPVLKQSTEKLVQSDDENELDTFLNTLRSALEIFVNRMNSNQLRSRPIANDTSVQSLFMNITNMHSQLLKYIQQQDDSRLHSEGLQDKLSQIRDARAALDALREEHQERLRREAEESERVRQQQMAHKLEIMRKKKQEYLQYQRQVALQRIQDQEREMQMRQEQQKYMWQQAQSVPGSVGYSHPHPQAQPPPPLPQYQSQGYPPHQLPPGASPAHVQYPVQHQHPQQPPPPQQQQQQQQQPHPQQQHPQQPPPHFQPDYSGYNNMQVMGNAMPLNTPIQSHPQPQPPVQALPPQPQPGPHGMHGVHGQPAAGPAGIQGHPGGVPREAIANAGPPLPQQLNEAPLISFD